MSYKLFYKVFYCNKFKAYSPSGSCFEELYLFISTLTAKELVAGRVSSKSLDHIRVIFQKFDKVLSGTNYSSITSLLFMCNHSLQRIIHKVVVIDILTVHEWHQNEMSFISRSGQDFRQKLFGQNLSDLITRECGTTATVDGASYLIKE